MENLIRKIDFLFNLLSPINKAIDNNLSEKQKKKLVKKAHASLWNMDTSILTIVNRFLEKIEKIELDTKILKDKKIIVKKVSETNEKNKRYSIFLDEFNIIPSNLERVAKSTLNQYLRVLIFFNLLYSKDFNGSLKNDYYEFVFTWDFLNFYLTNDVNKWLSFDTISSFIVKAFFSNNKNHINLIYGMLLCFIYELDIDKEIISISPYFKNVSFVKNKKINNKNNQDMESIKKIEKSLKETYKDLVNITKLEIKNKNGLDDNYEIIEQFVDLIIDQIQVKSNGDICYENVEFNNDTKIEEIRKLILDERQINNARSKLRSNILNKRNPSNEPHYSDIETVDKSINFLHDCIEQQEAAHILSVQAIKSLNMNFEEKLKYLEDANNGILIDHIYHDAFDRGWLILDLNGYFLPTNAWDEKYFNKEINDYEKYPLMKIKDEVFNSEMSNFIKKIKG